MILQISTRLFNRLLAQLSQESKAVDARLVAVAPTEVERITTDNRNITYHQLIRNSFGHEHALARPFIDTLRAGTGAAQRRRIVQADTTVRPGDAQGRVALLHNLARLNRRPASRRRFTHHQLVIKLLGIKTPSGILLKGFIDRVSLDAPVRSVPHGLAVAQDNGLR